MKLGYSPLGRRTAPELVAACRLAEELGIDEAWLPEDYLDRGVFTLAAAVASGTERIKIGVGVVNPWTRHPAVIAMEFAALDELSGGRGILGLGTSNAHWMRDLLGIDFHPPLSGLKEAVAIIRGLLSGATVAHAGDRFRVRAELSFAPLRPTPPVVLGVKGPRALAYAGQAADGVLLPVLSSPAYVHWAREQIASDQVRLAGYVTFGCGPDRDRIRSAARSGVAAYLGLHGQHPVTQAAGLPPALAERFAAAWRSGEDAAHLVTDDLLDTFAVVGDESDCARGLAALAEAGLDVAVINDESTDDPRSVLRAALRALG